MSKVITFSRVFPKYHPRAGKPTYFVEKITKAVMDNRNEWYNIDVSKIFNRDFYFSKQCLPKYYTIRAGNRWKVGDKFSPRVWSAQPYRSKQIIIAPDIEIKKIYNVILSTAGIFWYNDKELDFHELAKNDGLSLVDFLDWFPKPKSNQAYQIICWSDNIKY